MYVSYETISLVDFQKSHKMKNRLGEKTKSKKKIIAWQRQKIDEDEDLLRTKFVFSKFCPEQIFVFVNFFVSAKQLSFSLILFSHPDDFSFYEISGNRPMK